jgi:hypothetical protein
MARKRNTQSEASLLREAVQQLEGNEMLLRERLAELELAIEDEGWRRLVFDGEREFTREGLRKIMRLSRLMFLKNPLVNRAVTLQSIYVWGQGCTVTSTDEGIQALVDDFLKDERNQTELTSHQARTMKEQDLQVLGNLFFVFFSALDSGSTVVRTIPAEEIDEIITNPNDRREPWFYRRTWQASTLDVTTGVVKTENRIAYYPDFRFTPGEALAAIGGNPVLWDSPVYHVRVGGLSDMQFGLPETYQAMDWARAYNVFLENWSKIVQAYARFAFQISTKGGRPGIAAAKTRLNTTMNTGVSETNPPTQTGGFFIAGEGTDLQPIRTAGATTKADDARRLLLMICSAFGMPESFFGDVSVGNLATAKSLDRPTELKFRDRQELWKSVLITIIRYVVTRSRGAVNGRLRLVGPQQEVPIEVNFPPILEHDVAEQMAAITSGATLGGSPKADTIDDDTLSKLILTALGVQDVDAALAAVAKQRTDNQKRADALAKQIAAKPQPVEDEEQAA